MKNRNKKIIKKISTPPPAKKVTDDLSVSQRRAREFAAVIWDEWKAAMHKLALEEKLFAEHLPQHLNDLAARIQREVKDKDIRDHTIKLIDEKIAEQMGFLAALKFTVVVIGHCTGVVRVNNVEGECNWTAKLRVRQKDFEDGTAKYECPDCGHQITVADMTLLKDQTDEE